jgi:fluoroquinolone resistance protein
MTEFADRTLARGDLASLSGGDPVTLINCNLDDARLRDLDLTGWRFDRCSLAKVDFGSATLEVTSFVHCRGAGAFFNTAHLDDARFESSDFNNAVFRGAVLTSAAFKDCKLTGSDFTDARSTGTVFTDTLLVSAKLAGFSFRKDKLKGVDLSMADLGKCDFRDAEFEKSSLREANIDDARFEGADLRGADLTGLSLLAGAGRFKGAVVSAAQAEIILSATGLKVRGK